MSELENKNEADQSEPPYALELQDQKARDKKALSLFKRGARVWNSAYDTETYPFDDEEYSPNFEGLEFSNITLESCRFFGSFRGAKFRNCYFEGGTFEMVRFQKSDLKGCVFSDVDLTSTHFEEIATFKDAILKMSGFKKLISKIPPSTAVYLKKHHSKLQFCTMLA